MSVDGNKGFLNSPLGVAVVGGCFALGAVVLTVYLSGPPEPDPNEVALLKEKIQREREAARREKLEANCKRTVEGRYEAAVLVELLKDAVRKGSENLDGGENAKRACRESASISWEYLDGALVAPVLWIDAPEGDEEGGRLLCGCYPGNP